jgi:hypothetical protein
MRIESWRADTCEENLPSQRNLREPAVCVRRKTVRQRAVCRLRARRPVHQQNNGPENDGKRLVLALERAAVIHVWQ